MRFHHLIRNIALSLIACIALTGCSAIKTPHPKKIIFHPYSTEQARTTNLKQGFDKYDYLPSTGFLQLFGTSQGFNLDHSSSEYYNSNGIPVHSNSSRITKVDSFNELMNSKSGLQFGEDGGQNNDTLGITEDIYTNNTYYVVGGRSDTNSKNGTHDGAIQYQIEPHTIVMAQQSLPRDERQKPAVKSITLQLVKVVKGKNFKQARKYIFVPTKIKSYNGTIKSTTYNFLKSNKYVLTAIRKAPSSEDNVGK